MFCLFMVISMVVFSMVLRDNRVVLILLVLIWNLWILIWWLMWLRKVR